MADSPEHPVDYTIYSAADAKEMTQLLGEVFAHRDPPAVAVGLTPAEFAELVRLFCPKADAEELTIVARASTTGEMVGVLLAEDSASAPPEEVDRLSTKFNPIFDILGQMDTEYRSGRSMTPGESIHLFLLGVSPRYAGKGVAQRLVAECLAHAGGRGYRMAVTEATNTTSQHIFRKCGFIERVRRSYRDHRYDGQAVFASIAEHGGPILMDKQLD